MNLKLLKIIDVFFIFLLSVLVHFIYTWFPNSLFSIFFPVNESVWEHVKLLYTAIVIYGIVDFVFLKVFKIKYHNFLTNIFLSSFLAVIFFLTIYVPVFMFKLDTTFINIFFLFLSIIFSQVVSYYVLKKINNNLDGISLIGIILVYIMFGLLTYYPLKNALFYDFSQSKFGINGYNLNID